MCALSFPQYQKDPLESDQGSTSSRRLCVDALGNGPPKSQPGVECVASHSEGENVKASFHSSNSAGVVSREKSM